MEVAYLDTNEGRRLAYHKTEGQGPGLVFLGGFASDMNGTKAIHLEDFAKRTGRAFLRFDYSGHGQSSEVFEDGTIGAWAADAKAVITKLTDGPQILVGSSMGGWISLILSKHIPECIAGLVTIAAAPDFTEDSMWGWFTKEQKASLEADGHVKLPSDYGAPYTITKALIEEGRKQLVLRSALELPFPTRFLQGTQDEDVEMSVALRLLDHATGPDMRLLLQKGADHRFSEPEELQIIEDAIQNVLDRI